MAATVKDLDTVDGNVQSLIEGALEAGGGALRLAPAWVPRAFLHPGKRLKLHPDVLPLDGQKIFLKGYMYPSKQTEDIKAFVLCKDNGQCCFGGNPALTDMILVEMQNGITVNLRGRTKLTAVAGILRLMDPAQGGELSPVYVLEGTHFEGARTKF